MRYLACHETLVERTNQPQIWAVNEYHKTKFNLQAKSGLWISYNEFCDVDGTRTKVRPFGEETAAVIGHNCSSKYDCDTYSVCFALNGDTQTFNDAQIQAWRTIVSEHPEAEITLHRLLQPDRTCPGKLITVDYLKGLILPPGDAEKAQIAQYMGIIIALKGIVSLLLSRLRG